jgi:hypothetical protein
MGMRRLTSLAFVLASTLVAHAQSGAALNDSRGRDGLLADLERIVTTEEGNGWYLDRKNIEAIYAVVLQSVCPASSEARQEAVAHLTAEAARAGDPKVLFARDGTVSSEVSSALHAQRMHDTLFAVVQGAPADCPFYVRASPGYDGRQTSRNRFTLSLETGSLVQLRQTARTWGYGGGGTARFLAGYGFGTVSVLGGLELAGGAMLRPGDSSRFVINYLPAVPVLVRFHGTLWHYDIEAAAVSLLQADDTSISFGGRLGVGIGISALRTRFVIPWAGLAVAYEYYAESGGRPSAHFIRGGVRLGFQWDP